jgi:hypothetical protein
VSGAFRGAADGPEDNDVDETERSHAMRKVTLFKMLLALGLGAASVLGLFHAAAQPAQALTCAPKRFGCPFEEIRDVGGGICCVYQCASGTELIGPCEIFP